MPLLRADHILSKFGYCSRREAARWIKAGRVVADEKTVTNPGQRLAPASVRIDGAPVPFPEGLLVAFHKPAGCICTREEGEGETIFEHLPATWLDRNPPPRCVGRLDKDTTGLLILSDDGDLVHRWTSPRHEVEKVYELTWEGQLSDDAPAVFASGTLMLHGETTPCKPAQLEMLGPNHARLTLTEGRYHQVRRMIASQGGKVTTLHRSRVGKLALADLPLGSWREIRPEDVE